MVNQLLANSTNEKEVKVEEVAALNMIDWAQFTSS